MVWCWPGQCVFAGAGWDVLVSRVDGGLEKVFRTGTCLIVLVADRRQGNRAGCPNGPLRFLGRRERPETDRTVRTECRQGLKPVRGGTIVFLAGTRGL